MTEKKQRAGFTLAELLLTVAILVILFGIGFVAVNAYLKNLRLNEMDWTAKEIFIASQNQLSKAKENGTLAVYQKANNEQKSTISDDICYVIYGNNDVVGDKIQDPYAWDPILMPFGAIDETVRLGGSYIIEFNQKSGIVTQVYYSDNYDFESGDYDSTLQSGLSDRNERKNYRGNHIIGWYHGTADDFAYEVIDDNPILKVENADTLRALAGGIKSSGRKTLLCIKGMTSEATTTIEMKTWSGTDLVEILDDITSKDDHFANKVVSDNAEKSFIPGEDIELFATVSAVNGDGNLVLSNVPESNHVITNSLFASSSEQKVGENTETTVQISSFRHLLNLDPEISGIAIGTDKDTEINVKTAEQISDLIWTDDKQATKDFSQETGGNVLSLDGKSSSGTGNYYPITMTYDLIYEGNDRYIDRVVVNTANRNGGLFGNVIAGQSLTVNDLELRNFNISVTDTGSNAGALVGNAGSELIVNNVIAYNTEPDPSKEALLQILSAGNAGGLIGNASNATISNSVAAVYVKGGTTAGGLVGNLSAGKISSSYVGGHTVKGQFTFPEIPGYTANQQGRPNVWTTGTSGSAGGFIGIAGTGVSFTNSYTTASAYSASGTANLFVGNRDDKDVPENCYAAGWTYKAGKIVYPDLWMTDFVDNTTMESQLSEYNYDPFWDNDYYPYILIQNTDDVWFLKTHVGDWALPGVLIDIPNTKN